MKLYQKLAILNAAIENCKKTGNEAWEGKHSARLQELVQDHLPSGSGFDSGTAFVPEESTEDRLVFRSSYHLRDENGYYDGWIDFNVIVQPAFAPPGFTLRVVGPFSRLRRAYADIKNYIVEEFYSCLQEEI